MNKTLKAVLIVTAKNAVNALMVNITASQFWPDLFNVHTKAGLWAFAKLIGTVVGAREISVWGPVILKWSQSNGNLEIVEQSIVHTETTQTTQVSQQTQPTVDTKWKPVFKKGE